MLVGDKDLSQEWGSCTQTGILCKKYHDWLAGWMCLQERLLITQDVRCLPCNALAFDELKFVQQAWNVYPVPKHSSDAPRLVQRISCRSLVT